jgi:hypothetical protein
MRVRKAVGEGSLRLAQSVANLSSSSSSRSRHSSEPAQVAPCRTYVVAYHCDAVGVGSFGGSQASPRAHRLAGFGAPRRSTLGPAAGMIKRGNILYTVDFTRIYTQYVVHMCTVSANASSAPQIRGTASWRPERNSTDKDLNVIAKKATENAWSTRFRRGGDCRPAVWRANPAGPTHPILAHGAAGACWRDKALARATARATTASIRRFPRAVSVDF